MRRPRDPGAEFGKALDALQVAERKLARAYNRWHKARLQLVLTERRLDREQQAEKV